MFLKTFRQKSRLARSVAVVVLALLVLALLGLFQEASYFLAGLPRRDANVPLIRLVLLGIASVGLTVITAAAVALYVWARMSHSLPDLHGWHVHKPESEFHSSQDPLSLSLDDYLEQEDRVFAELGAYVRDSWSKESTAEYSRYHPGSVSYPENQGDINWNRTRICEAEKPIGGVLLLHGLSDSPYSLRVLGERLLKEGYTVIWLRLPGHGTTPRALAEISWEDWTAAVKVGVRGLRQRLPEDVPLYLAGYSNGGALSVHYTLEAIDNDQLPGVDGLLMLSPMIGINPLARITWFYHLAGLISRSEKSMWSTVFAEIDPFKYSSWPMNANVQAWSMTQAVERKLAKLEAAGRMNEFPPVFTAQSVVDSTVSVPKLITVLFNRLKSNDNELMLIDVNRVDALSNLLNFSFDAGVRPKLQREGQAFRLSVLANANPETSQVSLKIREQGTVSEVRLELTWPEGVVSLSHVAVPFPPSDPIYGDGSPEDSLPIGTMQVRAEPSALMVPESMFARSRHNPFYEFMQQRAVDWLSRQRQ